MPTKTRRLTLGTLLARVRRAAGYPQADLAAIVGKSQQAISGWENDSKTPNGDEVALVFRVCAATDEDYLALRNLSIPDFGKVAARRRTVDRRRARHALPSPSEAPQAGSVEGEAMPRLRELLSNRLNVAA